MAVGTTRAKRRLGRFIKPIRERSGRKVEEVAELSVCSRQTVQRLESGDALPSRGRMSAILGVIGASDQERKQAEQLWLVADADTVTIQHADALTAKYRRFRMDEAEAVRERTLDTVIIPGPLQTPEYASAISRGRRRLYHSSKWKTFAGEERRERQALLRRSPQPLQLHALIHEAAVRTIVGGQEVWLAQIAHLLEVMELPNVTVQVVPFGYGAHGAMTGPFFLLGFPEGDEPDSAYTESVTGLDTVEKPDDVAGLTDIWQAIADNAPSPEQSAVLIKSARDEVIK